MSKFTIASLSKKWSEGFFTSQNVYLKNAKWTEINLETSQIN